MNDEVYKFLQGYNSEVRDLALRVREVVLRIMPSAEEKVYTGWQTIGYSHSGGTSDHAGGSAAQAACLFGHQTERALAHRQLSGRHAPLGRRSAAVRKFFLYRGPALADGSARPWRVADEHARTGGAAAGGRA